MFGDAVLKATSAAVAAFSKTELSALKTMLQRKIEFAA
jgi:hypothetical protein